MIYMKKNCIRFIGQEKIAWITLSMNYKFSWSEKRILLPEAKT